MVLASATTIDPSATITATKILDHINKLRNTKVTDSSAYEIIASIGSLISYCNTKFLKDFPIDVIYKPTTLQPEIKSGYAHDLNLNNISEYIISTLKELESSSYHIQLETSNRCIDAIRVLVDHLNTVVLYRTDHYLELQETKLDGIEQSSNLVEISIHLVNGDDFYG